MAGNDKRLYKQLSHQDSGSGAQSNTVTTTTTHTLTTNTSSTTGFQALSPPQTFVGSPVFASGTSPCSSLALTVPSVLIRTMSGSSAHGLAPGGDAPQFCETISSRTLFYLRSTLTASFQPDYDFTDAKSEEFSRVPSIRWAMDAVRGNLSAAVGEMFTVLEERLWLAIEEEMRLAECDIYR